MIPEIPSFKLRQSALKTFHVNYVIHERSDYSSMQGHNKFVFQQERVRGGFSHLDGVGDKIDYNIQHS